MAFIIKSGTVQSSVPVTRQADFNFEDMSQQASEYLDQVRQEAMRIIEQARGEADALRARARHEGQQAAVAEARAAAAAAAEQKWESLQPALQQMARSVQELRDTWLQRWETEAIRLATAIAARIVRSELATRPELAQQWIREALELVAGSNRITVRLNPQDRASLGDLSGALRDALASCAEVEIVADPDVSAGGCRVRSEHGDVDARLETQIARITEELSD